MTFRNGYEGWGVKIFLKDSAGAEEEYAELRKHQSKTLQAYPGNVWVFKAESPKGQWQKAAFDEYVTTQEKEQTHFCHDDSRLISLIVDGRELVFRNKSNQELIFQWASKGHNANTAPHFRLQPINADSKYVWIARKVTDPDNDLDGWSFELKDGGGFLSIVDESRGELGLQPLKTTANRQVDVVANPVDQLQRSVWDFMPFAYLHENGQSTMGFSEGICLRSPFLSTLAHDQGTGKSSVLNLNPQTKVCYLDQMGPSIPERPAIQPSTLGLVPVPWGKDAGKAPAVSIKGGRDYFFWLTQDQPERRADRGQMVESLGQGFLGDLLGNEDHSLSGYNIHYLDPLNLQEHGLRGKLKSDGQRDGVAEIPHVFATIDPNASNTYYIVGAYRVPEFFFWKAEKQGRKDGSTSMYFSENELQESMSISVGVKGSVGDPSKAGVSTGGKGGYSETRRKVETENRVARIKSKWESDFWLTIDKQNIRLDSGFADYLLDRNNRFESYEDFVDLFARYGTHFPLSVLYGGRCVEESYLESKAVMNSMETKFDVSREGEAGAKGVSGGTSTSYSVGDFSAATIRTENENTKTHSIGGSGSSFELWSKGDSKSFAPIKVDLRPICDILRPELCSKPLTEADVIKIHGIRAKSHAMLNRYMIEEGHHHSAQNKTPRVFVAMVDYVKCVNADDALNVTNRAPDVWGGLDLGYARKVVDHRDNSARAAKTDVQSNTVGAGVGAGEMYSWILSPETHIRAMWIDKADDRPLDKDEMITSAGDTPFKSLTFAVKPVLKTKSVGESDVVVWDHDLENEFAYLHCYLEDADNEGSDKFVMPGDQGLAYKLINLSDVVAEPTGIKQFVFQTDHHDSAGQLEIAVTVRAVEISFNNIDTLPKAPFEE